MRCCRIVPESHSRFERPTSQRAHSPTSANAEVVSKTVSTPEPGSRRQAHPLVSAYTIAVKTARGSAVGPATAADVFIRGGRRGLEVRWLADWWAYR